MHPSPLRSRGPNRVATAVTREARRAGCHTTRGRPRRADPDLDPDPDLDLDPDLDPLSPSHHPRQASIRPTASRNSRTIRSTITLTGSTAFICPTICPTGVPSSGRLW
jgi:hypothetical protein